MQDRISVELPGGERVERSASIPVCDLLPAAQAAAGLPYLAALVNNDLCSLSFPLTFNCRIEFLTFAQRHGAQVFRRSLSFLLAKAIHDLHPQGILSVEHSLGTGYFCRFQGQNEQRLNAAELKQVEAHMRDLVAEDLPIVRRSVSFEEACEKLEEERQLDKLNLLRFRNPPRIVMYDCGDFSDLGHGVLAPATGTLDVFRIIPYETGFVLQFPVMEGEGMVLAPFASQPRLFEIFQEHKRWGKIVGINTVGDLNKTVASHRLPGLIQTSEALQEKKLGQIADSIAARRDEVRWILIAGPSSSGKTTFSRRLAVHLRVNGLRPVTVECDNYFKNRDDTPKDEHGEWDFEHIEAIDLELFNEHIEQLDKGEEVELPTFDFASGTRRFEGRKLCLEADQIMILEGIHGLNPALTRNIPADRKYRIYVSALTQLKIDRNNRLSTTDLRLIRRLVRDNIHRGNDALRTLGMWSNVRRGEKRWIFPFQTKIDMAFNSSLDYELSILKLYADPLLAEVKPGHPEYTEARRLQSFLDLILGSGCEDVPRNSLLREFIGGSAYES